MEVQTPKLVNLVLNRLDTLINMQSFSDESQVKRGQRGGFQLIVTKLVETTAELLVCIQNPVCKI